MNDWLRRDRILRATVRSPVTFIHFNELRQHDFLCDEDSEVLQSDLHWLGQRGFIDTFDCTPGDISTVRARPDGIDLVEHGISVETASDPRSERTTMESQINFNSGNSINIQGNHNSVSQSNENALVERTVSVLQENGETERANQLLELHEKEGAAAVFKQAFSWIADKVLAPSVTTALVPIVTQAMSML